MSKGNSSGKILFGAALIFIGLLILGDTLGFDFSNQIFPLILIGLGVYLMVRKRNQEVRSSVDSHAEKFKQKMGSFESKVDNFESKINEKFKETNASIGEKINQFDQKITDFEKGLGEGFVDSEQSSSREKKYSEASHKNGKVKYEKFIGDVTVDCNGVSLQNIEVSIFIGDTELKLHNGILADGLNRLIISGFIGDVRIFAPKDIEIFANCSNFIGGIEAIGKRSDGIGNSVESQTLNYDTASKKLYIACNNFIGDIKIYRI